MKTIQSFFQRLTAPLVLLACILTPSAASAHGGEDHGESTADVQSAQQFLPRAEAQSDATELLAVYGNKELTMYLSVFKTNEPIANAQVELESGRDKAVMKPVAPGVYKTAAPWLAKPGKYNLIVSIQGQNTIDLLEATMEIKGADAAMDNSRAMVTPAGLAVSLGGAAVLGMLAIGVRRCRKQSGESK
ncbi:MAG TPA: hypothetical protein VHK70_06390 [Burkholderiaceae bacterium]|jgi:hypothetical protein|nr:hypothetical protein [Burkholderiaceae bacterium]